jgi:hypothetical protein
MFDGTRRMGDMAENFLFQKLHILSKYEVTTPNTYLIMPKISLLFRWDTWVGRMTDENMTKIFVPKFYPKSVGLRSLNSKNFKSYVIFKKKIFLCLIGVHHMGQLGKLERVPGTKPLKIFISFLLQVVGMH